MGVIFWDNHGCIQEANQAFLRLTGFTAEDLKGMRWDLLTPAEHHAIAERAIEEVWSTGLAKPHEREYFRKDGSHWWGLSTARRINPEQAVEFLIDVSARRETEDMLSVCEERLRQIACAVPGSVFTFTANGNVDFIGYQHEALTGVEASQAAEVQWIELMHPEDRARVQASWLEACAAEKEWVVQYRLRSQRGNYAWALLRARPVRDADGKLGHWVGVVTDVDDLIKAREEVHKINESLEERIAEVTSQLRELSARLTMAEQLERRRIAQVLHDDTQQLLHGVQMQLSFMRDCLDAGKTEQGLNQLNGAEQWLKKAIETTRRITVEISPPVLEREGLVDAARWILRQMKELHGLDVRLLAAKEIQVKEPHLRVVLFQTIRELLFNVVKHSGTLAAELELHEDEGNVITVQVSDLGRGFDIEKAEARARDGYSFGLFNLRERLRLFGGRLQIETAPGKGSLLTARIPNKIMQAGEIPSAG